MSSVNNRVQSWSWCYCCYISVKNFSFLTTKVINKLKDRKYNSICHILLSTTWGLLHSNIQFQNTYFFVFNEVIVWVVSKSTYFSLFKQHDIQLLQNLISIPCSVILMRLSGWPTLWATKIVLHIIYCFLYSHVL
jgi:hypothetical protein